MPCYDAFIQPSALDTESRDRGQWTLHLWW